MTAAPIQFVTSIAPVLEVTVIGTAECAPLIPYLKAEEQAIRHAQDRTAVVISAVDSRYYGMRFQELSISIQLDDSEFFLAHAYNALPYFAFVERVFFRTPYYTGKTNVDSNHLRATHDGSLVIEAALAADVTPIRTVDESEQILVRLPKALRKSASRQHYFYARLEGLTEYYPLTPDAVNIAPDASEPIWKLLRDANFQAVQWRYRAAGRHHKSKTYHTQ